MPPHNKADTQMEFNNAIKGFSLYIEVGTTRNLTLAFNNHRQELIDHHNSWERKRHLASLMRVSMVIAALTFMFSIINRDENRKYYALAWAATLLASPYLDRHSKRTPYRVHDRAEELLGHDPCDPPPSLH